MTMELTDLALFLEVSEQGSLSRAAGTLRLAQPSVSARIANLERSLRVDLFDRSTRGVTLTSAGRALVPYARRCLALADEGRLAARASAGSHRLVMVAPSSLAPTVYPPLVAALAGEPLEIVCRTAHSREVVEQLADGAAHLGFLTGSAAPDGIAVEPLYRTPIICVVSPAHPLASGRPPALTDLAGHRVAAHSWGSGVDDLDTAFRAAGIPPTGFCWVSSSYTALRLATGHGYLGVLPADTAGPDLQAGGLIRVAPTGFGRWWLDVAVAYRQRAAAGEPIATALGALRSLSPTWSPV
jgi:DNA-binding transcriptional LysR family regulator